MGNGPGDLEDYEKLFLEEPGVLGGFVWEWCDHAVDGGVTADGRRKFLYGGDSGEFPHDINFCVDGLVSPDRIPHTGLKEMKNVWRPVRACLCDGEIQLRSTLDFADVSQLAEYRWELQLDYTGYGPQESYLDKKNACWFGHFAGTVSDEYVDYIKPQEHGSHMGCEQMRLR